MATEVCDRTEADEIRDLARAEGALFTAWLNDDESPAPGVEYWAAFDAWQQRYERKLLPIAAREMETLAREYTAWESSGDPDPPTSFWVARQHANEACLKEPPTLKPLETPAQLREQKVSIRQIAKIWRLLRPDGEPDIGRVEAELANPGSVITPEHIAMIDQQRLAELGFVASPAWQDESPAELPATETPSLDSLIADRANVEQIARIKAEQYGTDIAGWLQVVPQVAELMGVRLAQNASQVVNEGGQSVSEKIYGEDFVRRGQNVHPTVEPNEVTVGQQDQEDTVTIEPEDIDQKIVELFEAGQDVAAIARDVGRKVKEVRGVLRKWENSMKADGSAESDPEA